jgi:hypothetical protein
MSARQFPGAACLTRCLAFLAMERICEVLGQVLKRLPSSLSSASRLQIKDHERKPVAATGHPPFHQSPFTAHQSRFALYHPRTQANMRGATIVASDSMIYLGVSSDSLPQVIFSFGTAPE